MSQVQQPLIELNGASKSFGTNQVLHNVDFTLLPGEIHALVGENGAGKSTCLGLMYGLIQPDSGDVRIGGNSTSIHNPAHAQDLGIGCVFQELSLAGALSVAENIYAGRAPSRFGVVDRRRLTKQAEELLAELDLAIDVDQPVDKLPVSSRQVVEIAKALSLDSKILLLDEPTSALTPDEVKALFTVLRKLTARGIGIIYVSHHMSEVFEISDRITVLRDGGCVRTIATADTSTNQVVSDMIGGHVPVQAENDAKTRGAVVLEAQKLTLPGEFEDVSFTLRAGEIVGLAGLMGSRRSSIAKAIVGLVSQWSGQLSLKGKSVRFPSLMQAMKHGIGYVPEERKTEGLFLDFPVRDNLISASLEQHTRYGMLRSASSRRATQQAINDFSVKTASQDIPIRSLSGGNQQKIMLAKWLERSPQILVIDEPTKGVDIGAKFQIHSELRKRADAGMAIMVVSSDFAELSTLADRILVVREGRITGEIAAHDATEENILNLAAGVTLPAVQEPIQVTKSAVQ